MTGQETTGTTTRVGIRSSEESLQFAMQLLRSRSSRYAWVGTAIAIAAALLASLLVAQHFYGLISYENILRAHRENMAIWVLDTLPFLYAIWGQVASLRVTEDAGSAILVRTRELHRELRNVRHDARARTEYFARLSHEFRTPLNSILGVSEMMLETSDRESHHKLKVIQGAAENLLTLVNDVLDFSAMEVGHVDLDRVEFDLHECVINACALLRPQAAKKGLVFQLTIAPDVPRHVVGDPGRLRQVLINVAGNAVKFTQRGTVDVKLRYRGSTLDRMHEVVMTISDSGRGMNRAQLQQLFQPYQRGRDMLDGSSEQGTGLGMAITRELVDAMHGAIDVESIAGKGSRFDISLKVDRSRGVNIDTVARKIELRGVRLLLVDTPDPEREALLAQLKALEIDVSVADDGIDGLQAALRGVAQGRPYDMIMIGMHIEHLTGEALGQAIGKRAEIANTCLIMLTQVGTRGDAKRLKRIGFAGYFMKPLAPEHLGELLRATFATMVLSDEQRELQGLITRYYITERQPQQLAVLLVDDDAINLEVTAKRLEQLNCKVTTAIDAEKCLEQVNRHHFDLVLLDQNLPDIRGDEVLERMPRVALGGSPPPVVIFSAGLTQAEKQRCRKAGASGFLEKPASSEGLRETLRRYGWQSDAEPGKHEDAIVPGLKDAFARESATRMQEMRKALRSPPDRKQLYRITHTLKSATRHVAAEELAGAFDGFERQINQADDVTIQQYGEDILVAWQTVLDEFEAEDNDKTVRLGTSRRR